MMCDLNRRVFDLSLAIPSFLFLSPVMLLIALCIRFSMGKGVFFKQVRPGLNGKPFRIHKFRTMIDNCDGDGNLLPDGDRLTPFGSFLRSSSLDELPELYNVIKGEMSIVGPRPLLSRYLDRYTTEQARRHMAKPGITGWAQVNGRNAISWEEKFEHDVWYVDHQSFRLDIKIIALTIFRIITRDGINQPDQATAEEFLG